MSIGILGGTGPAGRGLAVRLAAAGDTVVIGSRDAARAASVAGGLVDRWPEHRLALTGSVNASAIETDLVVVATPWHAALATVQPLRDALSGQVVVSMVAALQREGREFLGLLLPRGSMAVSLQQALPSSLVSAAFHHLPASEMEKLDEPLVADVLVCSDHPRATAATAALVGHIEGLRSVDCGSLSQAAAIESFTAVLTTVNIRHKVHAGVRLTGYGDDLRAEPRA
jgi:8-hydroxy-5-deazaflavin:NADPH oxidoreductase